MAPSGFYEEGRPVDKIAPVKIRQWGFEGGQKFSGRLFGPAGYASDRDASQRPSIRSRQQSTTDGSAPNHANGRKRLLRAEENGWLIKDSWKDFDPAGGAVVSYPDYPAEEIEEMYRLGWNRWQWQMLTRRPLTVLHHFGNAFRREGLGGLLRLGKYSAQRFITVLGAH